MLFLRVHGDVRAVQILEVTKLPFVQLYKGVDG